MELVVVMVAKGLLQFCIKDDDTFRVYLHHDSLNVNAFGLSRRIDAVRG